MRTAVTELMVAAWRTLCRSMKPSMKPSIKHSHSVTQQKNLEITANYWSLPSDQLISRRHRSNASIEPADVLQRLNRYSLNTIKIQTKLYAFRLLLGQLKTPLVLFLVFAAIVPGAVGEWVDTGIVMTRTCHLFFRCRHGKLLLVSTLTSIIIAPAMLYLPFGSIFGFIPLPIPLILVMVRLPLLYILATELTKKHFYLRIENGNAQGDGSKI
jgi:magnesium-transporting ATPase (P-type)